ncbi:MAG: ribonuclease HII [Verrucomicrobia bacterium]|nr:ribonuclease HII [Verrucomicrobiota bacterium]
MAHQARPASVNRLRFELALAERGVLRIAGVDEAGRGPLAGPVTAAAVVLPRSWLRQGLPSELQGLNDSKQLSPAQRECFFARLTGNPQVHWHVASLEAPRVDALNILRATHQAMRQAIAGIQPPPQHILLDGRPASLLNLPVTPLVKGDTLSYSIAAASVLAKVTRDRLMLEYDLRYPGYGFAVHKGYGTPEHLAALQRLGPCPIHRRSFAPLKPSQPELFDHATLAPTQNLA